MDGFKKILMYAQEYRYKLYLAIGLILISVILGVIPYFLLYKILTLFLNHQPVNFQDVAYFAVLAGVMLYLKNWFLTKGLIASHDVAFDTLLGLRVSFARKMMTLPMGVIQGKGVGHYKKNFVDDIEHIETLIAHMIPEGMPYLLSPLIVFLTLLVMDWRMAFLALGSVPFGIIPIALMLGAGVKKMEAYYTAEKEMNKTIVEYISGMNVIKIFNRTTSSFEKYVENVENYRDYTLDWFKESWTYMALYTAVLPCSILLLLPVGLWLYLQGTLEASMLIFSLLLTMSIGVPLVKLVEFLPSIPTLSYKFDVLEKTFEDVPLKAQDCGKAPKGYDVTFKNVNFSYKEDIQVLSDVRFTARSKSMTAIVGPSGSGKSTLAKLLVHYWDVTDGGIDIGGVNIQDMSMEQLMNLVSYVSQDTFLFDIPIIENIRLGRPGATDEEVMEAAQAARCHDFIINLSSGYQTLPGTGGDKLSGGEKQRITIARAILKNAPIIVLDEATSSTDAENEDKIQEAINKLVAGKTLIVIAHHLSTIVDAEQIVVLDEGRIADKGTHKTLIQRSAVYKTLWDAYLESANWDLRVEGKEDVQYHQSNYSTV